MCWRLMASTMVQHAISYMIYASYTCIAIGEFHHSFCIIRLLWVPPIWSSSAARVADNTLQSTPWDKGNSEVLQYFWCSYFHLEVAHDLLWINILLSLFKINLYAVGITFVDSTSSSFWHEAVGFTLWFQGHKYKLKQRCYCK